MLVLTTLLALAPPSLARVAGPAPAEPPAGPVAPAASGADTTTAPPTSDPAGSGTVGPSEDTVVRSQATARRLFFATIIYLPLLLGALVADHASPL